MIQVVILQVFLFGMTVNEWIEITQVPSSRRKQIDILVNSNNIANTTFPSFDVTLERPSEVFVSNTMQIIQGTASNGPVSLTAVVDRDDANRGLAVGDNIQKKYVKKVEYEEVDDENGRHVDEPPSGFIATIKRIQNQLMGFKGKALEDKVQHLKKLKDKMLHEINYQISEWFASCDNRESESRLYKDSYFDYHHVDYPSNESALMTIGFLTFAVFLIKLVLKLIYALKMKQQYYYQTTTTPASIFLKKRQSEVDLEMRNQSNRIMQYLEEYSNV